MEVKLFWYDVKIGKEKQEKSASHSMFFGSWIWGDVVINNNVFYTLYQKNPEIRSSVAKISMAVSRNWLILTNKSWEVVNNPKDYKEIVKMFCQPTFASFKKELFKHFLISWELYIVPTKDLFGNNVWFQILDSRTVSKSVDIYWNILSFQQFSQNKTQTYQRDEVFYYQFEKSIVNENDWMWLMYWVIWDALSDLKSSEKNYALFENDSIPWWMLLLDWELSADEMKIAKEQFEREFRWTKNSHKMLVAWWIKDVKTLSVSQRDMEFINQKKLTIEKVSATFGVPKSILWYTDSVNYANSKEMRKEYLEWTIRPYEKDFEYILNTLIEKFYPKIYAQYNILIDWESTEDKDKIYEEQRKDIVLWIKTIDEIREERELEPYNTDESKNPLISWNMVLLEEVWQQPIINTWE